jgi:hypothetical protein
MPRKRSTSGHWELCSTFAGPNMPNPRGLSIHVAAHNDDMWVFARWIVERAHASLCYSIAMVPPKSDQVVSMSRFHCRPVSGVLWLEPSAREAVKTSGQASSLHMLQCTTAMRGLGKGCFIIHCTYVVRTYIVPTLQRGSGVSNCSMHLDGKSLCSARQGC